ncbi:E3 ubiquitin-protein ligase NEURL3 [Paralichthys olivaceus]|uniref:E3 ubiquitin-protein ligase NEURL3 n=1 Tax=Paralichthys olivaceus TaxID=8255 RepID=UPI0037513575
MMVKDSGNSGDASQTSHRCGVFCLGPLTFHSHAVGQMVRLSCGGRRAERTGSTFKNGLVFSSRPVKVLEKIRLRVEKDLISWHGALRVGFTNVSPSDRTLPLPMMAIPNLSDSPGHWAAPIPENCCQEGSEIEFWVSCGGSIYVTSNNSKPHKLLTGVDLRLPLWAMIDIYGQTCSILLLGSEKKKLISTSRSCPAPEPPTSPDVDSRLISDVFTLCRNEYITCLDKDILTDEYCVVCLGSEARITLPCGHRCLCKLCTPKVLQQFGTCPLCRHLIRAQEKGGFVSGTSGHQPDTE